MVSADLEAGRAATITNMDMVAGYGSSAPASRHRGNDDGVQQGQRQTHHHHRHPMQHSQFYRINQNQRDGSKSPDNDFVDLHDDDDEDVVMTHGDNNDGDDEVASQEESTVGWRETQQVRRFRVIVLCILVASCALVSFGVYRIIRRHEHRTMESHFMDQANKVVEAIQYTVKQRLGKLNALSVAMTSYGLSVNDAATVVSTSNSPSDFPWPHVTLESFAVLAGGIQALVDATAIVYTPIVQEDPADSIATTARSLWEQYSVTHANDWIFDGLAYEQEQQALATSDRRRLQEQSDVSIHETISTFDTATGDVISLPSVDAYRYRPSYPAGQSQPVMTYMPAWQTAPVHQDLVNIDLLTQTDLTEELARVLDSQEALVGDIAVLGRTSHFLRALVHNDKSDDDSSPVSMWYFPIFDRFQNGRRLVGVLTAAMYWETYFRNILPSDTPAIDVVLTSSCDRDSSYTFRVTNGQDVQYVGPGDLHENDDFKVETSDVYQFSVLDESVATYKGVPLQQMCDAYTLRLYATHDTKDEYYTDRPLIFLLIVVVIFVVTIMILFCYDRNVEARQRIVLHKAEQASAIVKSMFPAAVRKRLYHEQLAQQAATPNGVADEQSMSNGTAGKVPKSLSRGMSKSIHRKLFRSASNEAMSLSDSNRHESVFSGMDPEALKIKSFFNENPAAKEFAQLKAEALAMDAGAVTGPMADTFPETTILFADIVGFTAWSSEREPQQVFILLQTLYHNFDALAKKYAVFKVETIGDCYVAATGLPTPQPDHALRMSRFAAQCLSKMNEVTRSLEISLGPDTGELRMRVGLHSGPVAAGVLKGEKTRFQLFGDTVNTAARMESNGQVSRIHCSGDTAKLLITAGKSHWVEEREDVISAKGKGKIQTYWVTPRLSGGVRDDYTDDGNKEDYDEPSPLRVFDISIQSSRQQRLVDWNVEVLCSMLKQIAAVHIDTGVNQKPKENPSLRLQEGSTALDEVTEIIRLPEYDEKIMRQLRTDPEDIQLDETVVSELKDYVTTIASMYQPNSFHNFEHASHVTQSTSKLLKRIIMSDNAHLSEERLTKEALHTYSHGLATDPLTQFTLVFCALIHDVDHPGVSNFQLVAEKTTLAQVYKNKSVAEQNSVDIAWDLLMDERYSNLRSAIYCNQAELARFRQMMVNIVLATDIFDKDMKAIRERRWAKAFADDVEEAEAPTPTAPSERESPLSKIDGINLKATIVIEHLIQASDVSHCMQHFDIFMKWNERLFKEMYGAYELGRSEKDPSLGWYKGEIWFFDNYVIPLARKLDECGVFGAHSQEYLNYALQNRKRFALCGEKAVSDFKTRYEDDKKTSGKKMSLASTFYS